MKFDIIAATLVYKCQKQFYGLTLNYGAYISFEIPHNCTVMKGMLPVEASLDRAEVSMHLYSTLKTLARWWHDIHKHAIEKSRLLSKLYHKLIL